MNIKVKTILIWIPILIVIQLISIKMMFDTIDTGLAFAIKQNELITKQLQVNENKLEQLLDETNIKEQEIEKPEKLQQNFETVTLSVPNNNCNKTYMDYRTITSMNSPQYKLQSDSNVYTNPKGFRMIDDCYIAAVGTYYSDNIGDKLIVNMENGKSFNVVVGDFKADNHTDKFNKQHTKDGSVLEFIVDTNTLDPLSRKMGDVSHAYNEFKGEIESIERVVINE